MEVRIVEAAQGSEEWKAHRAKTFNASDLACAMGIDPNGRKRSDLVREYATGEVREFSDFVHNRVIAPGHEIEAIARTIIESRIGKELYPSTLAGELNGMTIGASLDGITMDDETTFECKRRNTALWESVSSGVVPAGYCPQMEQGLLLSNAKRCLFTVSDGTEEGTISCEYVSDPELRAKIEPTWRQFANDVANYQHAEKAPEAVGIAPETLPALHVELTGKVVASNLAEYKKTAMAIIDAVNTDLQTDQDFANAEKAVKWCSDVEERLEGAKQRALSQTASIDELFRTMDEIKEYTRQTRLKLDKLVKARKEALRAEIVIGARDALASHVASLNERIGKPYMPQQAVDFAAAIKGMRSFDSMRDAVTTALANAKIAANEQADRIERNLRTLREKADGYQTLFHDTAQLVFKAPDDLAAVITARIAEHKEQEERKLQQAREQAAAEERARLETEKAKMESEQPSPAIQAEAQEAAQPKAPQTVAQPVAESPKNDGATIKLGDIAARLGFTLTADFIEQTLGIAPAGRQRAAVLFFESDWPRICSGLVAHIQGVRAADHKREAA